jgi:hypothetical protein
MAWFVIDGANGARGGALLFLALTCEKPLPHHAATA